MTSAVMKVASQKRSGLAASALRRNAAAWNRMHPRRGKPALMPKGWRAPGSIAKTAATKPRGSIAKTAATKPTIPADPHRFTTTTTKTIKTPVVNPMGPLTSHPMPVGGQGSIGVSTTGNGSIIKQPAPSNPLPPQPAQPPKPGGPPVPVGTPVGAPKPPAIPVVKINENGQLDLPYGENFGTDLLGKQEEMNDSLLQLNKDEQDQQMTYGVAKRDLDKTNVEAKRGALNSAAAHGGAFGSMYGKAVADNATSYNNQRNDIESQNSQAKGAFTSGRTGIETAFNGYLRKAFLDRGIELEKDAGTLGFGKAKVEPVYQNQKKPVLGKPTTKPGTKPTPKPAHKMTRAEWNKKHPRPKGHPAPMPGDKGYHKPKKDAIKAAMTRIAWNKKHPRKGHAAPMPGDKGYHKPAKSLGKRPVRHHTPRKGR